jgi:hypothetical protein
MAKRKIKTVGGTREALQKMKYEASAENGVDSGRSKDAPPEESGNGEIVRRMIYEQLRQMQKEQPGDGK